MNVPGTFDWEADERRHWALAAAEPLTTLLAEQLLILQRLERSLDLLVTLEGLQTQAIQVLAAHLAGIDRDAESGPPAVEEE